MRLNAQRVVDNSAIFRQFHHFYASGLGLQCACSAKLDLIFGGLSSIAYFVRDFERMHYVLIKNGSIVRDNTLWQTDLLVANHKIVDMGPNLSRPDTETPVIDAEGKIIFAGAIDLHRNFTELAHYDQQQLNRLLQSQIISGNTCWFDGVSYPKLNEWKRLAEHHQVHIPDYAAHLLVEYSLLQHPERLDHIRWAHGINSLLFLSSLADEHPEPVLQGFLKHVRAQDLVVVIEVQFPHEYGAGNTLDQPLDVASFHLNQLQKWIALLEQADCKACFLNIRFREELELIEPLARTKRVHAEICLPFTLGSKADIKNGGQPVTGLEEALTAFDTPEYLEYVLQHPWCLFGRPTVDVINQEHMLKLNVFNRPDGFFMLKYFMSVLASLPLSNQELKPFMFAQALSERPARLFDLYPVKGAIRIGADADLVVWDPDYERNLFVSVPYQQQNGHKQFILKGHADFVFVQGNMVYNGEQFITDSIQGKYLYRID